ncbi:MAG: DUF2723 domain-containing protein [Myxococcales bacterium]|nr:DUF2723 domain-containing protein [Myxococcales bacterium]
MKGSKIRAALWWDAALVFVAAAALYTATMCRDVYWYDSAEYAAAAAVWGIPHPPGYPVYVLLGHLLTWLPMEPALAANWLSAVSGGGAVAGLYALCRCSGQPRCASMVASGVLALAGAVWGNARVAEVYTPALAVLAGVWWLLVDGLLRARPWRVLQAALVAGMGLGIHLSIATCGLGFVYLVAITGRRTGAAGGGSTVAGGAPQPRTVPRLLALSTVTALAGSAVFGLLPLRSAHEPAINMLTPNTVERFFWLVTGGNYRTWWTSEPLWRSLGTVVEKLVVQWGPLGATLLLVGAWYLVRERRILAAAIGLGALGNIGFFARYRVHDLEVFLLPTVFLGAWVAGFGVQALVERCARRPATAMLSRLAWMGPLVWLLATLVMRYPRMDLSTDRSAGDYGRMLVASLPRGAVILTYSMPQEWRYHAVFAHYFQAARGERPDVKVVTYLPHRLVLRLLAEQRPVYAYANVSPLGRHFRLIPEGPLFRVAWK